MLGQETPEQYYDAIINLKQRGNITDELAVFYLRTNVTEPILRAALDVRMPKTTREFRDYVRDFTRGKPMYQVVKGGNSTNYITVRTATPVPVTQPAPGYIQPNSPVYQNAQPGLHRQSPPATPPPQARGQLEQTWAAMAAMNLNGAPTGTMVTPPAYGNSGQPSGYGRGGASQYGGSGGRRGGGNRGRGNFGNRAGGGGQPQNVQRQPRTPQQEARQQATYVDRMEAKFFQWTQDGIFSCGHCLWGNHNQASCGYANLRLEDNPNRRWYLDWRYRYDNGWPLGSANQNYPNIVPPPRPRQQNASGFGGQGSPNRQPGQRNGGNPQNGGRPPLATPPPAQRPQLPPSPAPNRGPGGYQPAVGGPVPGTSQGNA
ncbi:basic salivary proline-rich protein 2-like [Paramacrobiotus metropolitanus]|uniref:basic salivary proline-rich protein 2-like n=1 Tax=Paramacrobiotus metropolitanus TaxID=2943436 RepID=UPI002446300E|nr:basic salivary proline-rich protein 2-like [Paramacrobiotus metropolitanus]